MTKFLLAIVLLVIGVNHTYGCNALNYNRYELAEFTLQSEETEREKGEQEKSKNDYEDEVFLQSVLSSSLDTPTGFLKISLQLDAFLGFLNNPTPPPDPV